MSFFPVCEDFPQIVNRPLTIINHFEPVFSLETPTITQCLGGSFLPPFFCPKFTFFARSHVLGLTGKKGLLLSPFQRCSVIAQLVEQATVNRPVVGSSPTHGATFLFLPLLFVPRARGARWDVALCLTARVLRTRWVAASRAQGCVLAPSFPLVRFASLHGLTVQPISCRFVWVMGPMVKPWDDSQANTNIRTGLPLPVL